MASPAVLTDFEADVRRVVLERLPHRKADQAGLIAQDTGALLIDYFNWRARLISARPRRVHVSVELAASRASLPAEVDQGLQMALAAAEAGDDLSSRLSRRITGFDAAGRRGRPLQPGKEDVGLAGRRDLDLLLNDWGLHHLHLSLTPEASGREGRSGLVLIAAVTATDFYAVNVIEHGAHDPMWTVNETLLPIVARNWPDNDELLMRSRFVTGLSRSVSVEEHKQLRQAGVSVLVEIDGAVYTRGGITLQGASMASTDQAMVIVDLLRRHAKDMADPEAREMFFEQTRQVLTSAGVEVPAIPQWHATLDEEDGNLILTEATISGSWPLTIASDLV